MGLCYMILSYEIITVIWLLISFSSHLQILFGRVYSSQSLVPRPGLDVLCSIQPQNERYQSDVTVLSRLRPFHFANSFSFFFRPCLLHIISSTSTGARRTLQCSASGREVPVRCFLVARGLSTSFYPLHSILSSLSSYIFINRHT